MKWKAHTNEQVAELLVGTKPKVISAVLSVHAAEAIGNYSSHYSLSLMCPDRVIEPKNDG